MKWFALAIALTLFYSVVEVKAQTAEQNTVNIRMWDACDPESFNAAVGPDTCLAGHHGQTLFTDFVAEVQSDGIAGAWRFNPFLNATQNTFKLTNLRLKLGDQTSVTNIGGEVHTFTRVKKFGGGFVDFLNVLSGNPEPVPECAQILPDGSLAPQPESPTNQFVEAGSTETGPSAGSSTLPPGVSHWQCCIHPWMRLTVVVGPDGHKK